MDAATARLITSPAGLSLLNSLPPYDPSDALTLGQALRDRGVEPSLVAAAMTQAQWRAGARAKFGEFADGMLFTAAGLEQATRLNVAAHHARRFREAGIDAIADLTCGIGADAMAAAALGLEVVAFEKDEATALIADHNLRHWDTAVVAHADSMTLVGSMEVRGAFADPARRNARGRRHDPQDYSPPLDDILALRAHIDALGVKVGPSIDHAAIPEDVQAQWISMDGSVVEAALWCGPLATHPGHSALVMREGQGHEMHGTTARAPTGPLSEYLIEPDGAVIRAGLVGELASTLDAHLIDSTIAYLTGDSPVPTPFASSYRVLDSFPYSLKRLARALKERHVGRVDIKKRGIDLTPEKLRPQLKLKGDAHATVVITRVAGRHHALIVEPL